MPANTTVSISSCPPVAENDAYTTPEDQTLSVSGPGNVLGNDYDPANPPQPLLVTVTPVCNTQNGSLALFANGNFNYIPAANYNGPDSFCYRVCDNEIPVKCDTGIVYLTVTPVNDPPVVNDVNITTPEDNPVLVCVNISDIESSQQHAVTVCDAPDNGSISNPAVNNASNPHTVCFTYTPSLNFNGPDSVCITVCDNGSPILCDQAIIRITVTPINDAPIANDDFYTMGQDTAVTRNVTVNDIDVDGPAVNITVTCPNTYGTLSMSPTGTFTYTPPVNFGLTDSFCYRYCDNGTPNLCDDAVVYLDYTGANRPPVAVDDYYTGPEDLPLNGNVLTNDFDPNAGSTLTANTTPVTNVQHGSLVLNTNGTFTYQPNANYNGPDTFSYEVCDNGLPIKCDTGFAFITITPVNDPPVINDTALTTPEDVAINVCLPVSDLESNDVHSAGLVVTTLHGSITGLGVNNIGPHELCFTYTPVANYNGMDSLVVQVCDNGAPAKCDSAKVRITITPVNDPPVAVNDNFSGNEDNTIGGNTLTNDSDIDGPSIQVPGTNPITCNAQHGNVSIAANGAFTYTPVADFFGADSFCYRICDNGIPNLCDTAAVFLTINPVNDKPVAPDTTVITDEDNPITVCIPISDADVADSHNAQIFVSPQNGAMSLLTVNNSGVPHTACLIYTPTANYNGTDAICLIICDNGTPVKCDTACINIIINPINDPPYADTVYAVTYVNQTVPVNVSAASGDLEGDPLTFTYGPPSEPGTTLSSTGLGALTVTPPTGFTGTITIPYTVCDISPYPVTSLCDGAAIIVQVLPVSDTLVNHAPIANNDYATTPKNNAAVVNVLANDYDPDGDALQTTLSSAAQHGTASLSSGGILTYQPVTNFTGFDTVYYSVCDPFGITQPRPLCDNAMVVIYVSGDSTAAVNDKPVATDDYDYVCADASSTLHLLNNDSDPNGDAISSVNIIQFPANGTLTNPAYGIYTYTPNGGFSGTENFKYIICDNGAPSLCDTGNIVIAVSATPVLSASVASLSLCNGDSANINFTSSVPNTTITWSGSDGSSGSGNIHLRVFNTSAVAQTVVYTATAVSSSGCGGNTVTVPVTVKPKPQASVSALAANVCSGNQVTILLASNQFGSQFNWSGSNGASGTGNVIIDNPANNTNQNINVTYSVVNTFNGCNSDTVNQTVVVKPRPVVTLSSNAAQVCSGLSVIVTISSNVAGTTYTWSTTSGLFGTSPVIQDFPVNPGNYLPVSVNYIVNGSAAGCDGPTAFTTVVVKPVPLVNAGLDKLFVSCAGVTVTLGGSPTAAGGTTPYQYAWSPAAGLSSSTSSNPVVSGINTDVVYNVTVTDNAGCSGTDAALIDVSASSLSAEAGSGGYICAGSQDSVRLGGFPTAVGGDPIYTYSWAPSGGLNLTNIANPDAKPTNTTTYRLTVTDQNGCMAIDSTVVNVKLVPTANAGADTTICSGQSVILGGNPTASGASGSGYSYSWSPVVGSFTSTVANPVAQVLATTTYTVTVTDVNGCTAQDNAVVVVRSVPVVDAGADKNLSTCAADTVSIGNVPLVTTGGTGPYSYAWTPSTGLSNTSVPNPLVAGISQTTPYQVIATDFFGCTGTDNVTVNVVQQTLQCEAGNPGVICAAANTPIPLGGFPTATAGTAPYTYSWSPTAGLTSSTAPNPIATVGATTVFYLTVTDAKGCVAIDSIKITQNPSPVANAGADSALCSGFGLQLGGSPTASGGMGTYQFSWAPTVGLSANNIGNPSAYPLVTTTYQVLVTDSNGCQATDAITITIHPNPVADAGPDRTVTLCIGDSVLIGGSPAASGGTGSYTYAWSPVGGLSSTTVSNPFAKGGASSSLYALTVTDTYGCSAADAVVVSLAPSTLSAFAGNDASVCSGSFSSILLGGTPTATGGTTPYLYTWSPTQSLSANNVANPVATPTGTTTYTVTVTDGKGCIARDSMIIRVNTGPIVNAGGNVEGCAGTDVRVGFSPTATGVGPFIYSWSPSIGLSDPRSSNPIITLTTTTVYTVVVTDANGCTGADAVSVIVHQNPMADAGADVTLVACAADSAMLGGSPPASGGTAPYTFNWTPIGGLSSATDPNPFVSHLGSSTLYTLEVTDQYGCSDADQARVNVTNSSLFAEGGNDVSVCQGAFAPVTLGGFPTATGGTPSYSYAWSPATGLSSASVANPLSFPTQTTLYTVVVTDATGCIATDTVRFTIHAKPSVNAGVNDTICAGTCITLGGNPTANTTPGPFTYNWQPTLYLNDPSLANPLACPAGTVTYAVTVTDQLGCFNSASITIKVNTNPVADAGADRSVVSCKDACVTTGGSPTASGGGGGYSYTWSPNVLLNDPFIANPELCNVPAGIHSYTVTVFDANGCSALDQVNVQGINSDLTADAGPDKTVCAGQNSCITIGGTPSITGGTAPFLIIWSPVTSFCNSNTLPNPDVNPVDPTTYVLLVKDVHGCVSVDSMNVIANPAVTAVVEPDTQICSGSAATLGGIPSTGSGGTAPYTYSWAPTAGLNTTTASNPAATPQLTTTYCVTVTDAVGCSASTCQAVSVNPALFAHAGGNHTIIGCRNSSATLGGSPAATGGSGNYQYHWTPATGLSDSIASNPVVANISGTTTYTLSVTDLLTGCSAIDQVVVTVTPSTLSAEAGPGRFICYDNIAGVQIGGLPTASGGQGPFTYQWTPGNGLSDSAVANPLALPAATTTYNLNVIDALGCSASDSVIVTIVQPEQVAITGLNSRYCINAGNVLLTGAPSGGTFAGAGVTGNIFQPSVVGEGTWCITYTYVNPTTGCTSDTVVCIEVDSLPALSVTGYNASYCGNDAAITLTGTPSGGVFSGNGISGNLFNPANANTGDNTITYTYSDTASGCFNNMQFVINVKEVPVISIGSSESSACPGADVTLTASYSLNVFNIIWTGSDGTTIYSGLNPPTVNPSSANQCYIATAVNSAGCVNRDTVCIQLLDCRIDAVNEACEADSVIMNSSITIAVLANDSIPAGSDTSVTISTTLLHGFASANSDHTVTFTPEQDFAGTIQFSYSVCVTINGFVVCDTANICVTIVDTTTDCLFPNTITPNNDGVNEAFEVSCNDQFLNADIRIYDRWGAEVFRSPGHYANDWNGANQQGVQLPDGTYFYMYSYNAQGKKAKKGFVDVYR